MGFGSVKTSYNAQKIANENKYLGGQNISSILIKFCYKDASTSMTKNTIYN